MRKILSYIVLFLCITQQFQAQEDDGVVAFDMPTRNSLKFNKYTINPTFSFVREQNKYITFFNKRQWVQFEDAPATYLGSYSGRFRENIGVGVGVFQQDFGVLTTFGGLLNFAYNAVLDTDSNLTFGMNVGFYKSGINEGRVNTNFPDPALDNIPSNSIITVNPGINYGTAFLDFGVSINNAVSYNLQSSKMIEDNPEQSIQPHIMYTGYLNSRGFFDESKFSGLLRSEFKKDETIMSALAMLTVPKGIWAQAGYNTLYGVSVGLGLNITTQIAIEYNYEKAMGDLSNFGNSHDITLAYKFKNKQRYNYSGDDDLQALVSQKKKKKVLATNRATPKLSADQKRIAAQEAKDRIEARRLEAQAKAEERKRLAAEARQAKTEQNESVKAEAERQANAERLRLEEAARKETAAAAAAAAVARAEAAMQATEERLRLEEAARKETEVAAAVARAEAAMRATEERLRLEEAARLEAEAAAQAQAEAERQANAERLRLEEATRLEAEAAAQAQAEAERQANSERLRLEEAARLEAEAAAQAQAEAERQANAERLRLEEATRLEVEAAAQAQAEAESQATAERLRLEEAARLEAEAERQANSERLRLEEAARLEAAAQAQAEAERQANSERLRLEEAARLEAEAAAQAQAEAERQATAERLRLEEAARLEAEAAAQAQAEAESQATAERLRLEETARLEVEAAAQAQAEAESQATAERLRLEETARLEAEAEAESQATAERLRLEEAARLEAAAQAEAERQANAERLRLEEAAKPIATVELGAAMLIPEPSDENTMKMGEITQLTFDNNIKQQELLVQLKEAVAKRKLALNELKEENDLSERGIVLPPKPFKSVAGENALLESIQVNLDNVIESINQKIAQLEDLFKKRLRKVKDVNDETNRFYSKTISELKVNQQEAIRVKEDLLKTLETIKVNTEIERKRRIKRASYDNEEDRYQKDRAALNRIIKTTPLASEPLTKEDFDSGEAGSGGIKIIKNIKNTESAFYVVIAVHSDVNKRDEFLTKAVAAGQNNAADENNIDFFFDVTTSKYYIYNQKFNDIETARKAMELSANKPYNAKMSLIKVEN